MVSQHQRAQIVEYIRTHRILDDRDFHAFVKRVGVSAHDAEPVVYQMAHDLAQRCPTSGELGGLSTGWKIGIGVGAGLLGLVAVGGYLVWRLFPRRY